MSLTLRDVRRGQADDELELTADDGQVVILHAHGRDAHEAQRTRERALALLADAGVMVKA